jgi:hypothetical protein
MGSEFTITQEQLQELLAGAIKAGLAPSPAEQKKQEDLAAKAEASRKSSRDAMMAGYWAKKHREDNCDHHKENGKWATSGQMLGNGLALTVCQHCQKEWYWEPSQSVAAQLLSGDLTLHQSQPPNKTVDPGTRLAN